MRMFRNRVKQLAKMFPDVKHPKPAKQDYHSSILSREVASQMPLADHLQEQLNFIVGNRHFTELVDFAPEGRGVKTRQPNNADLHLMRRGKHSSETNWKETW